MAHFLDKKYKTKISDADYDIIATGQKRTLGKDDNQGPVFGESARDYIEMVIYNTNGAFLESINLGETKKYINEEGSFKINPGVILRKNGYFSGDYEIEFNFLREVAGSNSTVLVDNFNNIYTGEFDVLIDGTIVKQGNPNAQLREIDYKYFIHQISNDNKEVRIATLPINDERYKREFTGLSESQTIIYADNLDDKLKLNKPSLTNSNEFTFVDNSLVQLEENMVGGELVINDAYEIMDLTGLGPDNDGFILGIGKKGANQRYGKGRINLGDKNNLVTQQNIFDNMFIDIGNDSSKDDEEDMATTAFEVKVDAESGQSGRPLFGGAFVMGYKTAAITGFPLLINTTLTDLDKIASIPNNESKIRLIGRDLVDVTNTFESISKFKFEGNGTEATIPIPTLHKDFGGLYDIEIELSFELSGVKRSLKIYKPNVIAVLPIHKQNDILVADQFINNAGNY